MGNTPNVPTPPPPDAKKHAVFGEETKRTVYIGWGLSVIAVGTGFILGGPYWGVEMIAVGAVLLLRGHFPHLFNSTAKKAGYFGFLVVLTVVLLSLRYGWFHLFSAKQHLGETAQRTQEKSGTGASGLPGQTVAAQTDKANKQQQTDVGTTQSTQSNKKVVSNKSAPDRDKEASGKPLETPAQGEIRGSDNTLVGSTGNRSIEGNGNTVVGATDSNGNTILNQGGTAIGSGASADSTSIAIGAHANAGGEQQHCETGSLCNQGSTVNAPQTVNNFGPPPLVLTVASVDSPGTVFAGKPGFIKTEITIVPNQQVASPFTILLEFDNPVSDIGNMPKGVSTWTVGGENTPGIHARSAVSNNISPSHPLVVVVFSLRPVKLVANPRIEF